MPSHAVCTAETVNVGARLAAFGEVLHQLLPDAAGDVAVLLPVLFPERQPPLVFGARAADHVDQPEECPRPLVAVLRYDHTVSQHHRLLDDGIV